MAWCNSRLVLNFWPWRVVPEHVRFPWHGTLDLSILQRSDGNLDANGQRRAAGLFRLSLALVIPQGVEQKLLVRGDA